MLKSHAGGRLPLRDGLGCRARRCPPGEIVVAWEARATREVTLNLFATKSRPQHPNRNPHPRDLLHRTSRVGAHERADPANVAGAALRRRATYLYLGLSHWFLFGDAARRAGRPILLRTNAD